ncbi:hypothetical protein P691DRAFT_89338 [Macrolepiota fuliginosa MF-IS2]|uniref:Uncharacterized protein n=1 Tax=Macrolepiota fuliginosa MF-IS2 TaxID=1400762 RepID=A0A9P5XB95_9AGAR|nr:hypothetical protein P691DRAFT_89338 [Macrolepiota fuliginosa MF-IS2]
MKSQRVSTPRDALTPYDPRSGIPSPHECSIYCSRSKASSSYYDGHHRSPTSRSTLSRIFLIPDDDKGAASRVNGRLGKRARSSSFENIPTIRTPKFSKRTRQRSRVVDYEDGAPLFVMMSAMFNLRNQIVSDHLYSRIRI